MIRKRMTIGIALVALLGLTVLGLPGLSYAKGGGGHGGGHHGGHGGHHGGHRGGHHGSWYHHTGHYYRDGMAFHSLHRGHGWFSYGGLGYYYWDGTYYNMRNNEYVVVQPPIGAVVPTIPEECEALTIGGKTYYNCNDVTYLSTPQGYRIIRESDVPDEN